MTKINKFASIFAAVGALLALGAVALSLSKLTAPPVLMAVPKEAAVVSEEVMGYLANGEYQQVEMRLYGTPDLGMNREPQEEAGQLIWQAFTQSMEYNFTSQVYATESGLARNVEVTTLDIASVTENLQERSETLLSQYVEKAKDVSQIYDENNEYREDFVMTVLRDAVKQSLAEDARYTTREITLHLIYQQDLWWVVPDASLLQVISGSTAG